jgi:dGTPase
MKNHGRLKNMKTSLALFGAGLVYCAGRKFTCFYGPDDGQIHWRYENIKSTKRKIPGIMSTGPAGYAVSESSSRGRRFAQKAHPYRSEFERDRDRIIHCSAFRRLEGKTQVFMQGLDDHYRTRLTHTIEVAQIGRTIARALGLNEYLTEAICLAHDLGHSAFGHSGEAALNKLTKDVGGFEHNRQALRVVDLLEHPYPDFAGLNLMFETRLGLAKHQSPYDRPGDDIFPERNCSLEGQAADIADRIAYNCHDLEDALRAGLIETRQLKDIELFGQAQKHINAQCIVDDSVRRTRTVKAIIDELVSEVIKTSRENIERVNIKTVEAVYEREKKLIGLSEQGEANIEHLEKFLLSRVYRHNQLQEVGRQVEDLLGRLFEHFVRKPELMPDYFQGLIAEHGLERTVCDYIAGMTDRYCLKILKEI